MFSSVKTQRIYHIAVRGLKLVLLKIPLGSHFHRHCTTCYSQIFDLCYYNTRVCTTLYELQLLLFHSLHSLSLQIFSLATQHNTTRTAMVAWTQCSFAHSSLQHLCHYWIFWRKTAITHMIWLVILCFFFFLLIVKELSSSHLLKNFVVVCVTDLQQCLCLIQLRKSDQSLSFHCGYPPCGSKLSDILIGLILMSVARTCWSWMTVLMLLW
jgi:hypothetical protein